MEEKSGGQPPRNLTEAKVRQLIYIHGCASKEPFTSLGILSVFQKMHNFSVPFKSYGFTTADAFLRSVNCIVELRSEGATRFKCIPKPKPPAVEPRDTPLLQPKIEPVEKTSSSTQTYDPRKVKPEIEDDEPYVQTSSVEFMPSPDNEATMEEINLLEDAIKKKLEEQKNPATDPKIPGAQPGIDQTKNAVSSREPTVPPLLLKLRPVPHFVERDEGGSRASMNTKPRKSVSFEDPVAIHEGGRLRESQSEERHSDRLEKHRGAIPKGILKVESRSVSMDSERVVIPTETSFNQGGSPSKKVPEQAVSREKEPKKVGSGKDESSQQKGGVAQSSSRDEMRQQAVTREQDPKKAVAREEEELPKRRKLPPSTVDVEKERTRQKAIEEAQLRLSQLSPYATIQRQIELEKLRAIDRVDDEEPPVPVTVPPKTNVSKSSSTDVQSSAEKEKEEKEKAKARLEQLSEFATIAREIELEKIDPKLLPPPPVPSPPPPPVPPIPPLTSTHPPSSTSDTSSAMPACSGSTSSTETANSDCIIVEEGRRKHQRETRGRRSRSKNVPRPKVVTEDGEPLVITLDSDGEEERNKEKKNKALAEIEEGVFSGKSGVTVAVASEEGRKEGVEKKKDPVRGSLSAEELSQPAVRKETEKPKKISRWDVRTRSNSATELLTEVPMQKTNNQSAVVDGGFVKEKDTVPTSAAKKISRWDVRTRTSSATEPSTEVSKQKTNNPSVVVEARAARDKDAAPSNPAKTPVAATKQNVAVEHKKPQEVPSKKIIGVKDVSGAKKKEADEVGMAESAKGGRKQKEVKKVTQRRLVDYSSGEESTQPAGLKEQNTTRYDVKIPEPPTEVPKQKANEPSVVVQEGVVKEKETAPTNIAKDGVMTGSMGIERNEGLEKSKEQVVGTASSHPAARKGKEGTEKGQKTVPEGATKSSSVTKLEVRKQITTVAAGVIDEGEKEIEESSEKTSRPPNQTTEEKDLKSKVTSIKSRSPPASPLPSPAPSLVSSGSSSIVFPPSHLSKTLKSAEIIADQFRKFIPAARCNEVPVTVEQVPIEMLHPSSLLHPLCSFRINDMIKAFVQAKEKWKVSLDGFIAIGDITAKDGEKRQLLLIDGTHRHAVLERALKHPTSAGLLKVKEMIGGDLSVPVTVIWLQKHNFEAILKASSPAEKRNSSRRAFSCTNFIYRLEAHQNLEEHFKVQYLREVALKMDKTLNEEAIFTKSEEVMEKLRIFTDEEGLDHVVAVICLPKKLFQLAVNFMELVHEGEKHYRFFKHQKCIDERLFSLIYKMAKFDTERAVKFVLDWMETYRLPLEKIRPREAVEDLKKRWILKDYKPDDAIRILRSVFGSSYEFTDSDKAFIEGQKEAVQQRKEQNHPVSQKTKETVVPVVSDPVAKHPVSKEPAVTVEKEKEPILEETSAVEKEAGPAAKEKIPVLQEPGVTVGETGPIQKDLGVVEKEKNPTSLPVSVEGSVRPKGPAAGHPDSKEPEITVGEENQPILEETSAVEKEKGPAVKVTNPTSPPASVEESVPPKGPAANHTDSKESEITVGEENQPILEAETVNVAVENELGPAARDPSERPEIVDSAMEMEVPPPVGSEVEVVTESVHYETETNVAEQIEEESKRKAQIIQGEEKPLQRRRQEELVTAPVDVLPMSSASAPSLINTTPAVYTEVPVTTFESIYNLAMASTSAPSLFGYGPAPPPPVDENLAEFERFETLVYNILKDVGGMFEIERLAKRSGVAREKLEELATKSGKFFIGLDEERGKEYVTTVGNELKTFIEWLLVLLKAHDAPITFSRVKKEFVTKFNTTLDHEERKFLTGFSGDVGAFCEALTKTGEILHRGEGSKKNHFLALPGMQFEEDRLLPADEPVTEAAPEAQETEGDTNDPPNPTKHVKKHKKKEAEERGRKRAQSVDSGGEEPEADGGSGEQVRKEKKNKRKKDVDDGRKKKKNYEDPGEVEETEQGEGGGAKEKRRHPSHKEKKPFAHNSDDDKLESEDLQRHGGDEKPLMQRKRRTVKSEIVIPEKRTKKRRHEEENEEEPKRARTTATTYGGLLTVMLQQAEQGGHNIDRLVEKITKVISDEINGA